MQLHNYSMVRPGTSNIPSFRRVPMERILKEKRPTCKTLKEVALYVGLPESVVKEHLNSLLKQRAIPKDSLFYRK